ncbi:MAG: 4Fe-4S dicluster domain-containing protein [Bryobacterales bacterium]|nr:4Fe-4S dicluster domain-containing protein [Bryobacterales bacterium]
MAYAILFDSTKCVGCRNCEAACAEKWKNPYNEEIAAEEKLSAHKLTAVQTKGGRFVRRMCMHCNDPACVSACPVGALLSVCMPGSCCAWSAATPSNW